MNIRSFTAFKDFMVRVQDPGVHSILLLKGRVYYINSINNGIAGPFILKNPKSYELTEEL